MSHIIYIHCAPYYKYGNNIDYFNSPLVMDNVYKQ